MTRIHALAPALLALAFAAELGCSRFEPSSSVAQTDAQAPDFTLVDQSGTSHSLSAMLAAGQPAVLVFYRGHW